MPVFPVQARVTALAGSMLPGLGAEAYSTYYKGWQILEVHGGYDILHPLSKDKLNVYGPVATVPKAKQIVDETLKFHEVQRESGGEAGMYRGYVIEKDERAKTYNVVTQDTASVIGSGFVSVSGAKKFIDDHIKSMAPSVREDETTRTAPERQDDLLDEPTMGPVQQTSAGGDKSGAFDWMRNLFPGVTQEETPPHRPGTPQPEVRTETKQNWTPVVIAGAAGLVLLLALRGK